MQYTTAPDQPAEEEQRPNLCPRCDGQGWVYTPMLQRQPWTDDSADCYVCQGEGVITRPATERDVMRPIRDFFGTWVRDA